MKKQKLFLIIIVFFCLFSSLNVYAEESKKKEMYCSFCTHLDENDPLYKKEKQFVDKIKVIKSIYGSSIDEAALAAAVLHRYTSYDLAYEKEFESDFNEEEYRKSWSKIAAQGLTDEEKMIVEENEKISLLTSAAIVMIDSNHRGVYSDVCFKEALAGDKFVNNDGSSGVFGDFVNAMYCNSSNLVLDTLTGFFDKIDFKVKKESFNDQNLNTQKICENGFIGGLYSGVSKIKDEKQKKAIKMHYAQEIIDLSNVFSGDKSDDNSCLVNLAGTTGDFAKWRQYDSKWGSISLGGATKDVNVKKYGCLVTSISMQIARSGTKIGVLPSGYSEFNPGAFVESTNLNGGFLAGGIYSWSGYQAIAPNWGFGGDFVSLNVSNNKDLADAISKELSTGYGEGNYQKFLVIRIHHASSSQHWIAVNGVSNGVVTLFDPARDGTTLDENYKNWVVDGYRVMYAKDVPFGQAGTTSNNVCSTGNEDGSSDSTSSGNGNAGSIKVPSEYSSKGVFTITEFDGFNWVDDCARVYKEWIKSGGQYSDGIAVINGRYLIACTDTFGKVGDKIDFYLEDGTKIPAIMFDTKDQTYAHGTPANKWGHSGNVLEFEVASSYYRKYGNPGNGYNSWHKEWAGKRVTSATNLGSGSVSSSNSNISSGGAYCENGVGYGENSSGVGNSNLNFNGATEIPDSLWKSHDSSADPSIVVVDDSGNVLAQRNPDVRREGGSLNKVFTGYAALKLLDLKKDKITCTKYVVEHSHPLHGYGYAGQTWDVVWAATAHFYGSYNRVHDSIPIAIGKKYYDVSNDKDAYFKGMEKINEFLKEAGCTNTNLGTGSGLNTGFGKDVNNFDKKYGISEGPNYNGFSASDLALVTIDAMKDSNFANHFKDRNKEGLFYIKSGTCTCGHAVKGFNKNGKRYYIILLGIKCNASNSGVKHNAKNAIIKDIYNWTINNLIK